MYEKRFDVFDSFFEDVNTFFGYLIISLVLLYIIYNLIVIIYDSIIGQCMRHCARRDAIIEFRKNRHGRRDLNARALRADSQLTEWRKHVRVQEIAHMKAKAEADAAAAAAAKLKAKAQKEAQAKIDKEKASRYIEDPRYMVD